MPSWVPYYRRFIKGFGSLSSCLTPAVSLRAPHQVEWTRRMDSAYSELRSLLCDHVMLCVPSVNDELRLYTDASRDGIGACFCTWSETELSHLWPSSVVS